MSLIKPTLQLILKEFNFYDLGGPAIALGVPEICATRSEFEGWIERHVGKAKDVGHDASMQAQSGEGKTRNWVSPKYFFEVLGLTPVTSVDIEGCEYNPDLIHDLNRPLPEAHVGRYRVVIDPGTIEHVFDMKTCLTNVVRALQIGGTVIHQVPVYMYNGGYYSLNPNVLNDFYAQNGFDSLKTYIIMWDRYHPHDRMHRCYEYTEELMGARHALGDADQVRYSPMMVFFAKKRHELAETVVPLQFGGNYHPAPKAEATYHAPRGLMDNAKKQIVGAVDRYLPPFLVAEMRSRHRRRLITRRTRKQSFWL
jgi:hypothetical protein